MLEYYFLFMQISQHSKTCLNKLKQLKSSVRSDGQRVQSIKVVKMFVKTICKHGVIKEAVFTHFSNRGQKANSISRSIHQVCYQNANEFSSMTFWLSVESLSPWRIINESSLRAIPRKLQEIIHRFKKFWAFGLGFISPRESRICNKHSLHAAALGCKSLPYIRSWNWSVYFLEIYMYICFISILWQENPIVMFCF